MFYRALIAVIVLFWLGMMGLLIRSEWFPQEADSLKVPTAYLWKLMFLHEVASDLAIYDGRERVGNLNLQPRRQSDGRPGGQIPRTLTAIGDVNVRLPLLGQTRLVLHGTVAIDNHNEAKQLRLSAVLHPTGQPANNTTLTVDGEPSADRWHYVVQRNNETVAEESGTAEHLLDRPELRSLGVNPVALLRLQRDQLAHIDVVARHGKLRSGSDEIDTFVVTIKDGNGLETVLHVNQLGQVLAVRTFTGVSLLDSALTP